jgi:Fe-S-cluster containining protein
VDRRVFFARADSDSISEACAQCPTERHCCYRVGTIVVSEAERKQILERHGSSSLLEDQGQGLYKILKDPGKPCPYLSAHDTCSIYDVRPKDCRSWPLTHQSPPRHGHFSADSLCPEIEAQSLRPEFIESAVSTLRSIPDRDVTYFAELVHQDENVLPLVDVDITLIREKK